MDKIFQIGDFCFRLSFPQEIAPPSNFLKFEITDGQPEYSYRIILSDCLPQPAGKLIARRPDLAVFECDGLESRLLGVKGQPDFYACYREMSPASAEIVFVAERTRELHIDPLFTSLLALEARLLDRKGLILHCAYTRYKDRGILFSAPSETGKTTQANLWGKYRGSRTINGDRALLQCVDGQWTARGWPVCGSSEVCNLLDTPVHCIVMLSQGKENVVRQLSPIQAFRLLYSQITINSWNRRRAECAIGLVEDIVKNIPVYHLSCTISEQAVDVLDKAIFPVQ